MKLHIVTAAAQDSVERTAQRALKGATGETTICFHMANHWLNRTAPAQVVPECRDAPLQINIAEQRTARPICPAHQNPAKSDACSNKQIEGGRLKKPVRPSLKGRRSGL